MSANRDIGKQELGGEVAGLAETAVIDLGGRSVGIRFPADIAHELGFAFGQHLRADPPEIPTDWITVHEQATGGYSVLGGRRELSNVSREDLILTVMDDVMTSLIAEEAMSVALHAGVVELGGHAILIAGASGAGKSSLVAWLVQHGGGYMTDELAFLSPDGLLDPFNRCLVMKTGSARQVDDMTSAAAVSLPAGPHFLVRPSKSSGRIPRSCHRIVFVQFEPGADCSIVAMNPGGAAAELIKSNLNARNFVDGGMSVITSLTRRAPALSLRYGGFDQLSEDRLKLLR